MKFALVFTSGCRCKFVCAWFRLLGRERLRMDMFVLVSAHAYVRLYVSACVCEAMPPVVGGARTPSHLCALPPAIPIGASLRPASGS